VENLMNIQVDSFDAENIKYRFQFTRFDPLVRIEERKSIIQRGYGGEVMMKMIGMLKIRYGTRSPFPLLP